jgi:multiple sugar transport system permease protein
MEAVDNTGSLASRLRHWARRDPYANLPAGIREALAQQGKRKSVLRRQEARWGYIFISTWLVGFVLWYLYPLGAGLYYSFTAYDLLTAPKWVGVQNYSTLIHDPLFTISLVNTLVYTVMSVTIFMVASLGGALLLNAKLRGIAFFRAAIYLPSQLAIVASSFIWLWIFNPQFGVANYFLAKIGIPQQEWLFDPVLAKPSIAIMSLWGIGAGIIIFVAGLQSIPESLYEAAKSDGAGEIRMFFSITIPMLSPVILFNLIVSIIAAFQVFDQAYLMTQGGPNNKTLFYVLYVFQNAFQFFKMGYASALSWILFVIVVILTALTFRLSRRWVHYELVDR